MPATAKRIEKTTTVRISRELADRVAERYPMKGSLADLYKAIDPWVKKIAVAGSKQERTGATLPKSESPKSFGGTIRLPKAQVVRLKTAGAWLGRTVSGLVEEKLWQLLA